MVGLGAGDQGLAHRWHLGYQNEIVQATGYLLLADIHFGGLFQAFWRNCCLPV